MRPASSSAALLDPPVARPAGEEVVLLEVASELSTYHVLLLAGEPRRHTVTLPSGIEAGSDIEVASERWTVADVRGGQDGPATLVCIYAV